MARRVEQPASFIQDYNNRKATKSAEKFAAKLKEQYVKRRRRFCGGFLNSSAAEVCLFLQQAPKSKENIIYIFVYT